MTFEPIFHFLIASLGAHNEEETAAKGWPRRGKCAARHTNEWATNHCGLSEFKEMNFENR